MHAPEPHPTDKGIPLYIRSIHGRNRRTHMETGNPRGTGSGTHNKLTAAEPRHVSRAFSVQGGQIPGFLDSF